MDPSEDSLEEMRMRQTEMGRGRHPFALHDMMMMRNLYGHHERQMLNSMRQGRERRDENMVVQNGEEDNEYIIKNDNIYFEDLILFSKKIYPKEEEEDLSILSLYKYKEMNINKLKEDIFYYCSSPDTLLKLNRNIDEEKNYYFYQDLLYLNFIYAQNSKNNLLKNQNIKLKSLKKIQKLDNYNEDLCVKMNTHKNNINNDTQIKNANLFINKIEEITLKYKNENDDLNLQQLNELGNLINKNKIDMEIIGLTLFNCIENYLCILLNLIIDKFEKTENNKEKMIKLGKVFIEILYSNFKSIKFLFLFIRFCSEHQNILESIEIDDNKVNYFISHKSLNLFSITDKNLSRKLFIELKQFIKDKEILNKIKNKETDLYSYSTINYQDNIFIFIKNQNKPIIKEKEDEKVENENIKKKDIIKGNKILYKIKYY